MSKESGLKIGIIGTGAGNMQLLAPDAPLVEIKDPITAEPVISGPHGKAWLCDTAKGREIMGLSGENDATLAHWIVEAPWAHPAWHSYSIVLVHLRPMPDNQETIFYLDDATHEMWLYALNPECDRNPVIERAIVEGPCWLHPGNFAAQFIEITDDLARFRVKDAVRMICDGTLSPDTDFRSMWEHLFGDNMMLDRPNARPPRTTGG